MIRGIILSLAISLIFFIILSVFEYFAYNSSSVRSILFFSYLGLVGLVMIVLVVIPLLKLYRIGQIISYPEASRIIGTHFGEISDKLLNSLQLFEMEAVSESQSDLIAASIEQKTFDLKPIPFNKAINLKQNVRFLKFALLPLVVILVTLGTAPSLVTEPTSRLINYEKEFERPAPFEFEIINGDLRGIKSEDFLLNLKISGESLPDKAFVEYEQTDVLLLKKNKLEYQYSFTNLQKDIRFRFHANGFFSQWYDLNVIAKPLILEFETQVKYPSYLNKSSETLKNNGDLIVPEGSKVAWRFYTSNTSGITFEKQDQLLLLEEDKKNTYVHEMRVYSPFNYHIKHRNADMISADSMQFQVQVIPDRFPEISVEESSDSLNSELLFFTGTVSDDYGLSKLKFHIKTIDEADNSAEKRNAKDTSFIVNSNFNSSADRFFYHFLLDSMYLSPGSTAEYYFEIWDNDGIHGSKSSKSRTFIYRAPSLQEVENRVEENTKNVEKSLSSGIAQLRELQLEIDQMSRKMVEKENLSWQDEKQLKDLLQKHKNLEEQLQSMVQENKKVTEEEKKHKKINEDILEKQAELQRLFDEIMDDEMKELFKELEKLLEENNKDKINDLLKEMKLNEEDLEKELDRNLELFKQLEFEKKYQEAVDELNKLADKQDENAEDSENKQKEEEDLIKKEEEIQEKFDEISKEIQDLEKKNEDLETPMNMEDLSPQKNEIQESIEESLEMMQSGKSKKSSASQKKASEQMRKMAEKMEQMMQESQEEQLGEDIRVLREILENLLVASFEQESLIKELEQIDKNDPQYKVLTGEQKQLIDDVQIIEDSLFALAKRQASVKNLITQEVQTIQSNLQKSVESLTYYMGKEVVNKSYKNLASKHQQQTMTSMNNLAVLLSEVLDQMNQDQNNMKGKAGKKCKNPKPGSSGKMKDMKQLQEQLNKQLKQLKSGMKPDGKKMGKKEMSQGMARMAAQQEALRRQLQKYGEELRKEDGVSNKQIEKILEEMEKTETDLINKILNNETLKRQQDILTRMLESEKAENEREKEEKRESEEAKSKEISNPFEKNKYKEEIKKQRELIHGRSLRLKPYYKRKVDQYYINLEQ